MFSLKSIIFNFFGLKDKLSDLYKDQSNKGFKQRYVELIAEDFDDNDIMLINNLIANTISPFTLYEQYLVYEEYRIGLELNIYTSNYFRRKILPLMYSLYDIKGTIHAYVQFFRMIGFDTCEIEETFSTSTFDDPNYTFDSGVRKFDSGAISGYYCIILTGTLTMTDNLKQLILNIIELNEPIYATLGCVKYNGDILEFEDLSDIGSFNESYNISFDR